MTMSNIKSRGDTQERFLIEFKAGIKCLSMKVTFSDLFAYKNSKTLIKLPKKQVISQSRFKYPCN